MPLIMATAAAAHTTSTGTVTTAAFTPVAGQLCAVVAMIGSNVGFTVKDSHSNTYTVTEPTAGNSNFGGAQMGIFTYRYTTSPGSTTITLTRNSGTTSVFWIYEVMLFTGAASYFGTNFHESLTSGTSYMIYYFTPVVTGSYIIWGAVGQALATPTVSPAVGCTTNTQSTLPASSDSVAGVGYVTTPTSSLQIITAGVGINISSTSGLANTGQIWYGLEIAPAVSTGAFLGLM